MNIAKLIEELLCYAKHHIDLKQSDVCYVRNLVMDALNVTEPYEGEVDEDAIAALVVPDTLIAPVGEYAVENGLCEDALRANFEAKIMGLLTPAPSVVAQKFYDDGKSMGVGAACDAFYDLQ